MNNGLKPVKVNEYDVILGASFNHAKPEFRQKFASERGSVSILPEEVNKLNAKVLNTRKWYEIADAKAEYKKETAKAATKKILTD